MLSSSIYINVYDLLKCAGLKTCVLWYRRGSLLLCWYRANWSWADTQQSLLMTTLAHVDTEPFPFFIRAILILTLHHSHSVFPPPVPPPSPTCLRYGWPIRPSSQCQETGVDSLQSTIQGSTHFTYVIHVLQCQLNSSMLSLSSVMMNKQWRRCWISARRRLSQTELFVPMIFCS